MSALFESTVEDIFKKFDMLMNKELGYCEFKGFCHDTQSRDARVLRLFWVMF